jgi:hypothetical protein
MPTERPPLVGEVVPTFADRGYYVKFQYRDNIIEQWYQPGVRVPPGVREDILGGT